MSAERILNIMHIAITANIDLTQLVEKIKSDFHT